MDQPAGLLRKMRAVMNVYNAFVIYNREGKKAGKWAEWRKENTGIWGIVAEIDRMRND